MNYSTIVDFNALAGFLFKEIYYLLHCGICFEIHFFSSNYSWNAGFGAYHTD